ncbi:hypothetical protein Tco_0420675 [Tanacetum coccineum]
MVRVSWILTLKNQDGFGGLREITYLDHVSKDSGSFMLKKVEYVDPKGISMQSGETKEVKLTDDTEVVEDKSSGDKGGNVEELVTTARLKVSTARPDIDAASQEDSAVEPRTTPTTKSIFDDEDITMAQKLIKMKEEKAKMDASEELVARLQMEERERCTQ